MNFRGTFARNLHKKRKPAYKEPKKKLKHTKPNKIKQQISWKDFFRRFRV